MIRALAGSVLALALVVVGSDSVGLGAATVPPQAVEHRIGVRTVDGEGEFYDQTTGETWVPRGFNHWRWFRHNGYLMNGTFRVGTDEVERAKADLAEMASYGYNAVRVWVAACFDDAPGCIVGPD